MLPVLLISNSSGDGFGFILLLIIIFFVIPSILSWVLRILIAVGKVIMVIGIGLVCWLSHLKGGSSDPKEDPKGETS